MVGLYASFCIAVIIAFVGGRPGIISAATGAMALLMVPLVKEHGLDLTKVSPNYKNQRAWSVRMINSRLLRLFESNRRLISLTYC